MEAPIIYIPGFISKDFANKFFEQLWQDLNWVRHDKVPRREYYVNANNVPYTYGTAPHDRTYNPQPSHESIDLMQWCIQDRIEKELKQRHLLDVCFLNGYENQSDQLGWHADDSPEMDDLRPIAIVSLGVEREIHFREVGNKSNVENVQKLKLEHGSLCLMLPGMQDTHQHRIPKASFMCGERISLTFRGYVEP